MKVKPTPGALLLLFFPLNPLSNMADRTTLKVASFSRRQTRREPFDAASLLLTEKKKKLVVYIDTVQIDGGPDELDGDDEGGGAEPNSCSPSS